MTATDPATEGTAPVDSSPLPTRTNTAPDLSGSRIVVVGGGMTAHRFAARLQAQDPDGTWQLTVIGEEPQQPYDRVHLSNWFTRHDGSMLVLDPAVWEDPRITLRTGDAVESLERDSRTLTLAWAPDDVDRPSDIAERLPKALIHRNVPGEPIHELLAAADDAWERSSGWAPHGPRVRWRHAHQMLIDAGWPLEPVRRRIRDNTLTVDWSTVAPNS